MRVLERWRWVPCYKGRYQVSDRGRIFNVRTHRYLYGNIDDDGYIRVSLTGHGHQETHRVHRLVALVFLGPVPEGKEVNHKNGVKTDNRLTNLEYVTDKENMQHAIENGLKKVHGESNPFSRLTWDDIREIRRLRNILPQTVIAKKFGTTQQYVCLIQNRKVWKEGEPCRQ